MAVNFIYTFSIESSPCGHIVLVIGDAIPEKPSLQGILVTHRPLDIVEREFMLLLVWLHALLPRMLTVKACHNTVSALPSDQAALTLGWLAWKDAGPGGGLPRKILAKMTLANMVNDWSSGTINIDQATMHHKVVIG